MLSQELAPLNAQIGQTSSQLGVLEEQMRAVEAELEKYSAAKQRVDALRDVCNALDKLGELKADDLFWKGLSAAEGGNEHLARVRGRVARFEAQISGILEKQAAVQVKIDQRRDELECLYEEVRDAYEREERRNEEFVIEREVSPTPWRDMIMPWTKGGESERRFRRAVLVALLICFFFGAVIPLITVPLPDRSVAEFEIPERIAMLVKQEPPRPAPQPEPARIPDESKPKTEPEKLKPESTPAPAPQKVAADSVPAPRKKAESAGILAFKSTFADLMEETPVAKLGAEAHLNQENAQRAGQAVAQRSLVTMQARGGSSGGIGNHGVSRNVGRGNADRLGGGGIGGGDGFARVSSTVASVTESARPLSSGPGPGRTDEEIQIVFDRYKAALYRIYNTELRKDPTLRGKMLLRMTIEPSGAVSFCQVESTDLGSPDLVAQIVERVRRFNFGPKEEVPKVTILYPIDFLPAA